MLIWPIQIKILHKIYDTAVGQVCVKLKVGACHKMRIGRVLGACASEMVKDNTECVCVW